MGYIWETLESIAVGLRTVGTIFECLPIGVQGNRSCSWSRRSSNTNNLTLWNHPNNRVNIFIDIKLWPRTQCNSDWSLCIKDNNGSLSFQGLYFPSMYQLWGFWAPPTDRSALVAISHAGHLANY